MNAYERVVVLVLARLSRPCRVAAVLGSSIRFPTHAVWHRVHVQRAARLPQLAALHIIMAKHVVQLVSEIMPSAETNNISKRGKIYDSRVILMIDCSHRCVLSNTIELLWIPDVRAIKQLSQPPLIGFDCFRVSFVEVASVPDQEMGEVTALSCDENFTVEANRVVESCQPR